MGSREQSVWGEPGVIPDTPWVRWHHVKRPTQGAVKRSKALKWTPPGMYVFAPLEMLEPYKAPTVAAPLVPDDLGLWRAADGSVCLAGAPDASVGRYARYMAEVLDCHGGVVIPEFKLFANPEAVAPWTRVE